MTAAAATTFQNLTSSDGRVSASGRGITRALFRGLGIGLGGALTLGGGVPTCLGAALWIMHATLSTNPHLAAKTGLRATAVAVADRGPIDTAQLTAVASAPAIEDTPDHRLAAEMFDARPTGAGAVAFSLQEPDTTAMQGAEPAIAVPQPAPAQEMAQRVERPEPATVPEPPAEPAPLPRARPADREPRVRPGNETAKTVLATPSRTATDERPSRPRYETPALPPRVDSRTAVYDISARMVYLPNGERLEAHSGLGDKMDDPRYVHVRMRGPTPPNVYDLKLREQLFHGVQAVRLNPVDQSKMFGRDGMLAHTYMLGPSGQSNGCVSFRDYPRFLRAVTRGEVDRLVVVARLGNASWRTVSGSGEPHRHYADITP